MAGWVVLKLAGKPRDIGYQYGRLASGEIDDAHQALRQVLKLNTGKDWSWFREEAKRLYWDKVDPEFQEEIIGQAEGLKTKGFSYDQWDVLAFNGYIELEGYYLPWLNKKPSNKEACSAFVATGSATKDGKPVMGHNLWWDYTIGQRFNLILDIKPEKGNRFVMDALCGFIHSGSDFGLNSAGIWVTETTISGFQGYDPTGIPEFVRMRKALQYSNSLADFHAIMVKGNNGGYANTWLLADNKTGEIGQLELGLKNVIFKTSRDGYFVGSNFPEDPKLRAEEAPTYQPAGNGCEVRRKRWNSLLTKNRGRVDALMARNFLGDTVDESTGRSGASDKTLCGRFDGLGSPSGAVNSKTVDSVMGSKLKFWQRMGISDGSTFNVSGFLEKYPNYSTLKPFLRDIPAQPWVEYPG